MIKINNRRYFIEGLVSVAPVRPGRFSIITRQGEFTAVGGRKSGGAAHEWFVFQTNGTDLINGDIRCNSLVECCRAIAQI